MMSEDLFDIWKVVSADYDAFPFISGNSRVGLLDTNTIAPPNEAALFHLCVDPYVRVVVLRGGAQDAGIPWEIILGQGRHDTAGAGTGDLQSEFVADAEPATNPVALHEGAFAQHGLDDDIRPKSSHLEAPIGIELTQTIERCRRQDVNCGDVEEGPLRHRLICHRLAQRQTLDVGPVLLEDRLLGTATRPRRSTWLVRVSCSAGPSGTSTAPGSSAPSGCGCRESGSGTCLASRKTSTTG